MPGPSIINNSGNSGSGTGTVLLVFVILAALVGFVIIKSGFLWVGLNGINAKVEAPTIGAPASGTREPASP